MKEIFESLLSPEAAKIELTPRQKVQRHNLHVFFVRAGFAEKFCKYCNWPMDPEPPNMPTAYKEDRCCVCIDMEATLWRSQYWQELDRQYKAAQRKIQQDNS